MKLARTAFVVVRNDGPRREVRNLRRTMRPNIAPMAAVRRPVALRLTATWHIDPQTQRPECTWSMEPVAADDQISRGQWRGRHHGVSASTVTHWTYDRGGLPRINTARGQRALYRHR